MHFTMVGLLHETSGSLHTGRLLMEPAVSNARRTFITCWPLRSMRIVSQALSLCVVAHATVTGAILQHWTSAQSRTSIHNDQLLPCCLDVSRCETLPSTAMCRSLLTGKVSGKPACVLGAASKTAFEEVDRLPVLFPAALSCCSDIALHTDHV